MIDFQSAEEPTGSRQIFIFMQINFMNIHFNIHSSLHIMFEIVNKLEYMHIIFGFSRIIMCYYTIDNE